MMRENFYLYFIVEGKTDKEFLTYFLKTNQINQNFNINILEGNDDDKLLKAIKKGLAEFQKYNQSEKYLLFILDQDEETENFHQEKIEKILQNINKNYSLNQKNTTENLSFHLFLMNPCLEAVLNQSLNTDKFSTDHFTDFDLFKEAVEAKKKWNSSQSDWLKSKNYVYIKYDVCQDKTTRKKELKNYLGYGLNQNAFHLNHPKLFPLKKFLSGFFIEEEIKEKNNERI